MDSFDNTLLRHWLEQSVQLLQRFSVVVVAFFALIRVEWLRRILREIDLRWHYRIYTVCLFAFLAVLGSHNGVSTSLDEPLSIVGTSQELGAINRTLPVISFRDTIILTSGLIGGPLVGAGVGFLAGLESYLQAGNAGLIIGLSSFILGIYAGCIKRYQSKWIVNEKGVLIVGLTGAFLQFLIILLLAKPLTSAWLSASEMVLPVGLVNSLGCVLFFWIMRDLDRERLEKEAHEAHLLVLQAELRTFRAQVDPHFLNNTLNDLNSLIRRNPDKAREYIIKLADFFKYTREFSLLNSITLNQELAQLKRFLDLQRLGLDDKLQENYEIQEELLECQILPGCLLALVENTLKHGFKGRPAPYRLKISAKENGIYLVLQVTDNGCGIPNELVSSLGKQPVKSQSRGGGVALYHLVQSLQLVFGERAKLSFESIIEQYTVATLTQPKWISP
ncbi:MAG: hypothetical protein CTY34_03530 [Methylobacter sp.]|nr:MAG: hypothetical protein CTY34_03530 [Methylobacter sp.]PPD04712.1 MAG: hypothetical protein CTY29_04445 [Methylobacter sp.]